MTVDPRDVTAIREALALLQWLLTESRDVRALAPNYGRNTIAECRRLRAILAR
jgi:hypothetical protein